MRESLEKARQYDKAGKVLLGETTDSKDIKVLHGILKSMQGEPDLLDFDRVGNKEPEAEYLKKIRANISSRYVEKKRKWF